MPFSSLTSQSLVMVNSHIIPLVPHKAFESRIPSLLGFISVPALGCQALFVVDPISFWTMDFVFVSAFFVMTGNCTARELVITELFTFVNHHACSNPVLSGLIVAVFPVCWLGKPTVSTLNSDWTHIATYLWVDKDGYSGILG